jgi:hypothetical protein
MEQWDNQDHEGSRRQQASRPISHYASGFGDCWSTCSCRLSCDGFREYAYRNMVRDRGHYALGVVVALLLRFTPKKFRRVVLGAAIIFVVFVVVVLFWEGRKPRRPPTVSSDALYVLPDNVPFTLHKTGYWVDCWFDEHANVDRCKLTDEKGAMLFEDVFLPCIGKEPLHQSVLVSNGRRLWTADIWNPSPEKGTKVPVVFVNGQYLLPRSFYAEAKRDVYCPPL